MGQGQLVKLQNTTAHSLYVTRTANLSRYGAQLNTQGWYENTLLRYLHIIINSLKDKCVWFFVIIS